MLDPDERAPGHREPGTETDSDEGSPRLASGTLTVSSSDGTVYYTGVSGERLGPVFASPDPLITTWASASTGPIKLPGESQKADEKAIRDAAKALAETFAEQRYVDFLSSHRVGECMEDGCHVCSEMTDIKADTIRVVRDQMVDRVWDEMVKVFASADDTTQLQMEIRKRLVALRAIPINDLW